MSARGCGSPVYSQRLPSFCASCAFLRPWIEPPRRIIFHHRGHGVPTEFTEVEQALHSPRSAPCAALHATTLRSPPRYFSVKLGLGVARLRALGDLCFCAQGGVKDHAPYPFSAASDSFEALSDVLTSASMLAATHASRAIRFAPLAQRRAAARRKRARSGRDHRAADRDKQSVCGGIPLDATARRIPNPIGLPRRAACALRTAPAALRTRKDRFGTRSARFGTRLQNSGRHRQTSGRR